MLRVFIVVWGLFILTAAVVFGQNVLPIVSATQLDTMTLKEISTKYFKGFRIDYACLSKEFAHKIKQLNELGLTVQPTNSNTLELQSLTLSALKSLDLSVFFAALNQSQKNLEDYWLNEYLQYSFRMVDAKSFQQVVALTPAQLESLYEQSHFWKNLGFLYESRPNELDWWINNQLPFAKKLVSDYLVSKKISACPKQCRLFAKLCCLDVLSNAVRGLYYAQRGTKLTFYRQLAVDNLVKLPENTL